MVQHKDQEPTPKTPAQRLFDVTAELKRLELEHLIGGMGLDEVVKSEDLKNDVVERKFDVTDQESEKAYAGPVDKQRQAFLNKLADAYDELATAAGDMWGLRDVRQGQVVLNELHGEGDKVMLIKEVLIGIENDEIAFDRRDISFQSPDGERHFERTVVPYEGEIDIEAVTERLEQVTELLAPEIQGD